MYTQLRGDPARNVPGGLDLPANQLLTPDTLYDHFVPRLVEEPELRPYHDVVMGWWQREGQNTVPESSRHDATRALKLLLLAAVSPARRQLSPTAVMQALLLARSRIDPAANLRYAAELLAALARAGTFIRAQIGPDGEPAYRSSSRADASVHVNRRLAEEERRLGPDDRRPFWTAARAASGSELPLDTLVLGRKVQSRWQNTARTLQVRLNNLDELGAADVDELLAELASGTVDGVLLLAAAAGLGAQRQHLQDVILPRLRESPGRLGRAVAFLLPAPLDPEGEKQLRRAHAYGQVAARLADENSDRESTARAYLEGPAGEARRRALAALAEAYAAGEVNGAEGPLLRPAEHSVIGFQRLAVTVADRLCSSRYPRHSEIRPGSDQFGLEALEAALTEIRASPRPPDPAFPGRPPRGAGPVYSRRPGPAAARSRGR